MNTTTEKQTGFAPFRHSWGGLCRLILGSLCLGAVFTAQATEWTYTPGKEGPNVIGTITDGQWTLKVTGFDKENGVLKFANWWGKSIINAWTAPADSALSGVLDLRRPLTVVDEAGGVMRSRKSSPDNRPLRGRLTLLRFIATSSPLTGKTRVSLRAIRI